MFKSLFALCILVLTAHEPGFAAESVDGKLVVAIDGSASLQGEGDESHNAFQNQFMSTIAALSSDEVSEAISEGRYGCIGLTIFTWSGADPTRNHGHPLFPRKGNQRHRTVLSWQRWCAGDPSVRKALEALAQTSRQFYIGGSTSISAALFDAGNLCDNAPFEVGRCVIDLSADQLDNDPLPGMGILAVRAHLHAREHQVNGLPLVSPDDLTLEDYFSTNVITPDGFVFPASRHSPADGILRALKRKFALEIAQL